MTIRGAAIMGGSGSRGQYNGNIAASTTALRDHCDARTSELGMVYTYDHLYRLLQSRGFERTTGAAFAWNGVAATAKWATDYTYDANGNIKTLQRKDQAGTLTDNLTYAYESSGGRLVSNKLYNVNDAITGSTLPEDYEVLNGTFNPANAPGTGHFKYDEIGNLKSDISAGENIGTIEWNLYGKLKKVTRTAGTKNNLEFYYDAAGRRVMKIVKSRSAPTDKSLWQYAIFSYDAGGKLMAEYEIQGASGNYNLVLKGRYVYGANKAGKTRDNITVSNAPVGVTYTNAESCTSCATATVLGSKAPEANKYNRTLGNKQYEFGNHLGNVLVTVSDKKIPVDDGVYTYGSGTLTKINTTADGKLDYYLPDVLTTNDYYPGGMPMPGRTMEGGSATNTSTVTNNTPVNHNYSSNPGYTSFGSATVSVSSGVLSVSRAAGTGTWGSAFGFPVTAAGIGIPHKLTFSISTEVWFASAGARIKNSAGTVVATITCNADNTYNLTFTPTTSGTYTLEFFSSTASAFFFLIDNTSITYTTYTNSAGCSATSNANQYAWGHNTQLKDNEIYGSGNAYSAEYWEYDARLLRRWNTDPITYDWQSPYACFNNNPIYYADPLGLEGNGPGDDELSEEEKAACGCKDISFVPNGTGGLSSVKIEAERPPGSLASTTPIETKTDEGLKNSYSTQRERAWDRMWDGNFDEGFRDYLNYSMLDVFGKPPTDNQISAVAQPVAQIIAESHPAIKAYQLHNGLTNGTDGLGNEMETIDYIFMGVDIIPAGKLVNAIGKPILKKGGKTAIKIIKSSDSEFLEATKTPLGDFFADFKKLFREKEEHIFSASHIKGGIMDLGKNREEILDGIKKTIQANMGNIKEGHNFIFTKMNGHDATIKFMIRNGEIISVDLHKGLGKIRDASKVNVIHH